MKAAAAILLSMLLVSGCRAQQCNPANSAGQLASADPQFLTVLGELACKVPSDVNLAQITARLSGTLTGLTLDQLKQLPGLVEATITVNPATLAPFFSLSASEVNTLAPLLTQVSADKLQQVLPLLARQPEGTLEKLLRFLNAIPQSKLEQLSPLFACITEGQVNILIHAAQNLPRHAWQKLIHLVRALGPVTDVIAGAKQSKGFLSGSCGGGSSGGGGSSTSYTPAPAYGQGWHYRPWWSGRKLRQECVPSQRGTAIGFQLLSNPDLGRPVGEAVCKFTAAELAPVLRQVLEVLSRQSQETLANLPAFTEALASVQPDVLGAVFQIPTSTLSALLPVLSGLDPNTVQRQLKTLAAQSSETINKIIFFINNVLLPLFVKLNEEQLDILAEFLNALSPGQIVLAIHLLDTFGYHIDAIGRHIPTGASASSGTAGPDGSRMVAIGPVTAVIGGRSHWWGHYG